MSETENNRISADDMPALTKVARLALAGDRPAVVAPALDGTLTLLDALDAIDIGETPPTNSFDARWRDL